MAKLWDLRHSWGFRHGSGIGIRYVPGHWHRGHIWRTVRIEGLVGERPVSLGIRFRRPYLRTRQGLRLRWPFARLSRRSVQFNRRSKPGLHRG